MTKTNEFIDKVVYDAEAAIAAAIGEVRVLDARTEGILFDDVLAALIEARVEMSRAVTRAKLEV